MDSYDLTVRRAFLDQGKTVRKAFFFRLDGSLLGHASSYLRLLLILFGLVLYPLF